MCFPQCFDYFSFTLNIILFLAKTKSTMELNVRDGLSVILQPLIFFSQIGIRHGNLFEVARSEQTSDLIIWPCI